MQPQVSIVARSPGSVSGVEVVVTLPTFRRPDHLLRTLASLDGQKTSRRFAVIVMENEADEQAGAKAARSLFVSGATDGMLIVAHERGNCSAYNAGWQTALVHYHDMRWLMVIDDDELADPNWIERMCDTAETLEADIVGGPQRPVFESGGDSRAARHPVFRAPYDRTGIVPALYSSGNLAISRKVLQAMPAPFLDTRFNFLGGGDADFLSRAAAKGFRLGWCEEAPVMETVPARRLESDWIRARSLRNGVISTLVERRKRDGLLGAPTTLAHSLMLLGLSPLRGAAELLSGKPWHDATYPAYIGLGRVAAHFGYQNEQYRQPDKN